MTSLFFSVTVPESGPRQVVPEYGNLIVSPAIGPEPLRENAQFGTFGIEPVPVTVAESVEFSMCPVALPLMLALPRHTAVKVPAMSLAVCVVMFHLKLLHDWPDEASAGVIDCEVHDPSSEGITALGSNTLLE